MCLNTVKKKIGLYGGTFNPIHMGHLILAENMYEILKLDEVIFIPTGVSYLKNQNEILSSDIRVRMVKEAIMDNSHFSISTYETEKTGNTYTYETLDYFNSLYPDSEIYFLIGEDTLYNIDMWKNPQEIFNKCIISVANRNHESDDKMQLKKKELEDTFGAKIILNYTSDIDISSHMIRERIKNNISIKYLVPENVYKLIIDNNYYKI